MTSPEGVAPESLPPVPVTSPDPLLDTLPGAVVAQQESPTVLRIGVVAAIIEGSQITVRISGSDVLVDCAYLFNQYWPLLGDRVIVLKQDSQWVCLGQMSGAIDSNNPLPNSSFEEGAIGAIPTGWTLVVGATGAGTPTFLVATTGSTNISGVQVVDFGTDSVGSGVSTAEAFSPTVMASPGTKWTAAYFFTSAFVGSLWPMFSDITFRIQFLDAGGTIITSNDVNYFSAGADVDGVQYRRLALSSFPAGYVIAPPGTAFARVTFLASFELPASSFVSFFIDNVILRQVD